MKLLYAFCTLAVFAVCLSSCEKTYSCKCTIRNEDSGTVTNREFRMEISTFNPGKKAEKDCRFWQDKLTQDGDIASCAVE